MGSTTPSGIACRVPPSSAPGHGVVGARGDGGSRPAVSQPGCPFGSVPVPSALRCPSTGCSHLGRSSPSRGGSRKGTPPRELPVPRPGSPRWLAGPFPAEQEPQGPTSGLHIWRPAVAPPPHPGPQHLGLRAPVGQPPAPCRNPRGAGAGEGAAGAPDGGTLAAAGPGPWGRWLGAGGGLPGAGEGVCVSGGNFPAQTDGAGLELWLPEGHVWAERWRGSADVLGWDSRGPCGTWWLCHRWHNVPQPRASPTPLCVLQRRRLQVPRGPAAPGLRQGEPWHVVAGSGGDVPDSWHGRLAQPGQPGTAAHAEARALCAAQPGNGNPLPTKGACPSAGEGDPAPGSAPVAAGQARLGGPGAPQMLTPQRCLPQIYPDPELEAQVLSLAIRCIHSEEGCRWSGLIKHLQVGAGRTAGGGGQPRLLPVPPHDLPCRPPPPSPGPSRHLRLQRHPLPQPVQHQAEPPRPARARPARLPQAPGQVRVLRQRLHRGGLRGGRRGGGDAAPGGHGQGGDAARDAVLWQRCCDLGARILGWVARWVRRGDHDGLQGTVGAQRGPGDEPGCGDTMGDVAWPWGQSLGGGRNHVHGDSSWRGCAAQPWGHLGRTPRGPQPGHGDSG